MILKVNYLYKDEIYFKALSRLDPSEKPNDTRYLLITEVRGIIFRADRLGIFGEKADKNAYYTDTKMYTEVDANRRITEIGPIEDFPEYQL